MFKLVGSGCHLYVRPGETIWSIANKLNGDNIYLRGGLANTTCPAHPSSSLDHEGEATNWEYYNYGVYNWHKATLLLRCPTHDVANSTWLVEQGREGLIPKGKVGAYLCQEDKDGSCLLADLNVDLQQEVAAWNPEAAEKVAHRLSLEILQWLIKQRMDGHFDGKELGHVLWKENKEGTVAISQLYLETCKEVALWSPEETNNKAHLLNIDFIQWLITKAEEGKWSKEEVASIAWRENKEGIPIFTQLDLETQKQLALWSPEETSKNAHLASQDFIVWLIAQAREGKCSKQEVGNIVFRKSTSNHLIFATLDNDTKREVGTYNKKLTISALPYMDADFLRWVYEEASEGRWDQQQVFNAVVEEESDGRAYFAAKIK